MFQQRTGIYVALGEKEKAFESLERGREERFGGFINVDPIFDPPHPDPRFACLLRRMNLQL